MELSPEALKMTIIKQSSCWRQAEVDAKQREAAQQIDPQLAEGIAQAQATLLSSDIGGKHAAAAFLNYANERLRNQQQSRKLGQKLDRQQRDNKQQIEDSDYMVRNAEGYQHGWKVYEKPQPGYTYGSVETNPYGQGGSQSYGQGGSKSYGEGGGQSYGQGGGKNPSNPWRVKDD
jgi:uncharacterized membrane protein YgcG